MAGEVVGEGNVKEMRPIMGAEDFSHMLRRRSGAFIMLGNGIGPASDLRHLGIDVAADLPGVGANLQNHAILFIAAHLKRGARQAAALRPHPVTCLRYSSGIHGAPASDMYMSAHSKSSWNALGGSIANFGATLFKPAARGRKIMRGS